MRPIWNEENISKALKKMPKASAGDMAFDRIWFKIEDALESRKKHLWGSVIWRPWLHPVRWVAAAACLCVAFTGELYHQNSVDKAELANYVMSVLNPGTDVTSDWGFIKVSTLLLEHPTSSIHGVVSDETNKNKGSLSNDALFL